MKITQVCTHVDVQLVWKGVGLTLSAHADLFAIFKTTEKLERAYVRDAISSKDYEPACQKLIGQYKTLWDSLKDTVRHVSACCSLCPT